MNKAKSIILLLLLATCTWIRSYGQQACDSCVVLKPKEIDFFIKQKLKADNLEYRNGILSAEIMEYRGLVAVKNGIIQNNSQVLAGADLLAQKQYGKIDELTGQRDKYYKQTKRQRTVILILSTTAVVFGALLLVR